MKNIKYLIMDVDGTLTDGKIYMTNSGELMKAFNIKDGFGIRNLLPEYNIQPMIITGRHSKILENRCKEIGIVRIYQNVEDKVSLLESVLSQEDLNFSNIAYIGDDLNDLECLKRAGIKGCPADAVDAVIEEVDFISIYKGGEGAVRDFIEWLVREAR